MARKLFCATTLVSLIFATAASAAPALWSGNGNYYDLIPTSLTWDGARTAALNSTFLGAPGHLATITSAVENAFINTTFNTGTNSNFAWIGGYEPLNDGVWRWADGPEAGIQFSNFGSPTPPFNYANWGGIEPNNHNPNEDYLMFNIGLTFAGIAPGQWADATPVPSEADPVVAYVVEFETSTIPEPSTFAFVGVGIIGLLGCCRRQNGITRESAARRHSRALPATAQEACRR